MLLTSEELGVNVPEASTALTADPAEHKNVLNNSQNTLSNHEENDSHLFLPILH